MSNISVNTITDALGGSTASINGLTPQASNMQPHNLIINGAMTVAQRGTSVAGLGNGDNGYHTIDRYRFSESGSPTGEFTMSQSTDAPDGFGYSMKFDCTTADTSMASGDRFQVSTRIEGQNCQQLKYGTSDAQSLLLSFWVKSSKTGTYCIGVVQPDNGAISFVREYTVSSANTWEYKTLTIDGDTSGVISNGNGNGLELGFALAAGTGFHSTAGTWTGSYEYATSNQANLADSTSNTWQITGVQLEAGSTASSFAHENYGDTLRKCMRYYEKSYNQGVVPGTNTSVGTMSVYGGVTSATTRFFGIPTYLVPKRASGVSITFYTSTGTAGSISKYNASSTTLPVASIGSGYGEYRIGAYIQTTGGDSTDPYVFHYTAESEL